MKAMILKEPRSIEDNPLELVNVPTPEPGAYEIRIEIRVCGVCHTDLHTVEGELPLPKRPIIPGHEIVGVVEKLGKGVTQFKEGDRVGMAWLYSTCGKCSFCRRDRENLCQSARFTGYHVDGGYTQYAIVPEGFAYRIPQIFSDREATPLLCAGIIGYRALRLSEVKPGQRLGLYGFGASAHIVMQIAIHWGCPVYVFSRSREHLDLAEKLGAVWTGQAKDDPPDKVESAIIFAPAGGLVLDALRVLDKGGTLTLAGIYMTPIPVMDYNQYLYHERTIRSVTASTRRDGHELLEIAADIPIRAKTQTFRLEEANDVLRLLKRGRINGAAVLEISP
jgi:propanol-preferring alcohol dehydrogenase